MDNVVYVVKFLFNGNIDHVQIDARNKQDAIFKFIDMYHYDKILKVIEI